MRRFGLGRIAVRQLRSHRTLFIAQVMALAAAGTLVTGVVLIQRVATDDGLRTTIVAAGQGADVFIERDGVRDAATYDSVQADATARVRALLGGAVTAGARSSRSSTVTVATIDGIAQGPPITWNPSLVSYEGLSDHVHVVAGHWPADVPLGRDWPITISAHATDDLGTPLDVRVGSEYCFMYTIPGRRHAPETWCGRVAATWLPASTADPYWAGHVPETAVATGHNSFFEALAQMPDAVGSAEQEYVPATAGITENTTDRVINGVNRLRGQYAVSGNDVFVSGLDTTIAAYLDRAAAAAGPTLVTAVGIVVVALAGLTFTALQFLRGQRGEVALWRARGWSRRRVLWLFGIELTLVALCALPIVLAMSMLVATASTGARAAAARGATLVDALVPALASTAAFLVVLMAVAAGLSGQELSNGRRTQTGQRFGRLRLAGDAGLVIAGIAVLLLVHSGGASGRGDQSSPAVLALPIVAAGFLAVPAVRIVDLAAHALRVTRSLGARLARWQVERDPRPYARVCLLVILAVTVGVFAASYSSGERINALDRADYNVGADVRAVYSSAASPPRLDDLTASLPHGVTAAQVLRGIGRPGRSGNDATVVGVQGAGFWRVAFTRPDFAAEPLPVLTSRMDTADPDGLQVHGSPRSFTLGVDNLGVDVRLQLEITDANGDVALVTFLQPPASGWQTATAVLPAPDVLSYPLRVRAIRLTPVGPRAAGVIALQDLRTDAGVIVESFDTHDGWWREAFAPDTEVAELTPSTMPGNGGHPAMDIAIDKQTVLLEPPASSKPLPVLLGAQTMEALGVGIGQTFPLHIDTVDVQVVMVGTFDNFPTYYPGRELFMVAPLISLTGRIGHLGATSPWPNELWTTSGVSTATVTQRLAVDSNLLTSMLRSDAETLALHDPLRLGLGDVLGVGFVVALAVVVIGFGLHFLAVARSRVTQFAIMRANGVSIATLRGGLIAEQVVVLLVGLIAGTVIGLALSWAVTPFFHLGTLPEDLTPASRFHADPLNLLVVIAGTGALALGVGGLVAQAGSRVDVMAALRSLS